jgi:glyceraldehyde 3-phosphate dehydrogenase
VKRLRIGINGFGRIGRTIFRINHKYDLFDVIVINDINPDTANLAYLLRYDSVYGTFNDTISIAKEKLIIRNQAIAMHHCAGILDVPWQHHGIDVLIDATSAKDNAALIAGQVGEIGHYICTHAAHSTVPITTIVFGANEHEFDPTKDRLLSASICDTVALGPLIKLLEDRYGVEYGHLATLHPWLIDQNLLDGNANASKAPDAMDSHYALGRSAVNNLIPKSTTAVLAADAIFPGISKKIESFSYRVPTTIVSSGLLNVTLANAADQSELIEMFYRFERDQAWNIINNGVEPKVSLDYCGNEFSVSIDHRWTALKHDRHLRLVYWYDNEWGYSSRVVDLLSLIAGSSGRWHTTPV